jgi:hypothetical protein
MASCISSPHSCYIQTIFCDPGFSRLMQGHDNRCSMYVPMERALQRGSATVTKQQLPFRKPVTLAKDARSCIRSSMLKHNQYRRYSRQADAYNSIPSVLYPQFSTRFSTYRSVPREHDELNRRRLSVTVSQTRPTFSCCSMALWSKPRPSFPDGALRRRGTARERVINAVKRSQRLQISRLGWGIQLPASIPLAAHSAFDSP